MSDITYRRFEAKDRADVLSLFEAAFGKPRDPGQWTWEFLDGPKPAIIVVAESDGKIVGHYAILPRMFRAGRSIIESGLVVDVMTHPQYGKRGIFINSGLEAFRQAKVDGLKMLIGFPNEAAIRGHQKVGWSELGSVGVFARPLKGNALKESLGSKLEIPGLLVRILDLVLHSTIRISLGDSPGGPSVTWILPKDIIAMKAELESFRENAISSYPVCNSRNMDWMNWRYSDPLDSTFTVLLRKVGSNAIVGMGSLKVKEKDGMKTGAVMDVMALEADWSVMRRLLKELMKKAVTEGCELMIIFESPASARKGLLRKLMILETPRRLRFIVRSVDGDALPEEVFKLGNWHLELIDHDVI